MHTAVLTPEGQMAKDIMTRLKAGDPVSGSVQRILGTVAEIGIPMPAIGGRNVFAWVNAAPLQVGQQVTVRAVSHPEIVGRMRFELVP